MSSDVAVTVVDDLDLEVDEQVEDLIVLVPDTVDAVAVTSADDMQLTTPVDTTVVVQLLGTVPVAFKQLTDVPQSYAGQAGRTIRVKADETGLEFFDVPGSDNGISGASLAAVGATGNGTTIDFAGVVRKDHSMQVEYTSNPSAVQVAFQLWLFDWFTVATWDLADGRASGAFINITGIPALKARAVLLTLTGGTTPAVTASIASK